MTKYFILLSAVFFSCSPILPIFTTPDAKQKWTAHKKIAIIPFRISSDNEVYKLSVSQQAEERESIKQLSYSVQHDMYNVLLNQYRIANLSVTVLHPDSTTFLLAASGINYSNIPQQNINSICKILQVDAVIAGNIDFYRPAVSFSSRDNFERPIIEKADVKLSIYDKDKSVPIWTYKQENAANKYNEYYKRSRNVNGSNQEYLIAYMFDKAMKALPYVIKSPLKRFY